MASSARLCPRPMHPRKPIDGLEIIAVTTLEEALEHGAGLSAGRFGLGRLLVGGPAGAHKHFQHQFAAKVGQQQQHNPGQG